MDTPAQRVPTCSNSASSCSTSVVLPHPWRAPQAVAWPGALAAPHGSAGQRLPPERGRAVHAAGRLYAPLLTGRPCFAEHR